MSRSPLSGRKTKFHAFMTWWLQMLHLINIIVVVVENSVQVVMRKNRYVPRGLVRMQKRSEHLQRLIYDNNVYCRENLRVDTHTFVVLCELLGNIGDLKPTKDVGIDEMVALFLSILAHHTKIRTIRFHFWRSAETIHRHFRKVLSALIRCHSVLLAKAEPVPIDSTDQRWKWFKGCLGALNGTHIPVRVDVALKPRYRTRKAQIATNVLGVCNPKMEFIFVYPGWEGSAADGRVLRVAFHSPNGLRVPRGQYYLCDAGYTNGEGFLAPYRGQRYHRSDWSGSRNRPSNPKELFNYRHSSARNVIERAFGAIKMRWAILRSPSFYPIDVHTCIIGACCLLHNLITREMPNDPIMEDVDAQLNEEVSDPDDFVTHVDTSQQWTQWHNHLDQEMWNTNHPS